MHLNQVNTNHPGINGVYVVLYDHALNFLNVSQLTVSKSRFSGLMFHTYITAFPVSYARSVKFLRVATDE